jgi:hypothetical protein
VRTAHNDLDDRSPIQRRFNPGGALDRWRFGEATITRRRIRGHRCENQTLREYRRHCALSFGSVMTGPFHKNRVNDVSVMSLQRLSLQNQALKKQAL